MAAAGGEQQEKSSLIEKDRFPEVVLLKIFSNLSIHDLGRACLVCKQWNSVIWSDVVWKRFVPKWPWFEPPPGTQDAHQIVKKLWKKKSVRIGNERWLVYPIPELMKYEKKLRKAEYHNYYTRCSSMTLMARLNPCYEFTTKGKDLEDATMNAVCEEIWNKFGGKEKTHLELESHQDVMRRAQFLSRKEAMTKILKTLEPSWFLKGLELELYALDEDGEIIAGGGENREEEGVPEEEEDDIPEKVGVSSDESIFGSYGDKTAWKAKINKRLSVELLRKIKAFFADGSNSYPGCKRSPPSVRRRRSRQRSTGTKKPLEPKGFIEYYLSDGCFNENFQYAYSLLISDTAVFHIKQFYEL